MNNSEEKHRRDLEAAKNWYKIAEQQNNEVAMNILKDLFPELSESRDIGTQLINSIKSSAQFEYCLQKHGFKIEEVIAWLEKQGEQRPVVIDVDKMVAEYANNKERNNEEFGKPVNCMIRAYRQGLNDAIEKIVLNPAWSEEDEDMIDDIIRCLKRCGGDMLAPKQPYQKEIDWLKSLKDRVQPQQQEWSEEDEKLLNYAISMTDDVQVKNFLKSFKDKTQPQSHQDWSQDWSEEDEEMLNDVILDIKLLQHRDTGEEGKAVYQREIDWLKSLKPQNHWKPSEEQILSLQEAISVVGENSISGRNLIEISEQLKNFES